MTENEIAKVIVDAANQIHVKQEPGLLEYESRLIWHLCAIASLRALWWTHAKTPRTLLQSSPACLSILRSPSFVLETSDMPNDAAIQTIPHCLPKARGPGMFLLY